jgi:hypothetical protein
LAVKKDIAAAMSGKDISKKLAAVLYRVLRSIRIKLGDKRAIMPKIFFKAYADIEAYLLSHCTTRKSNGHFFN